MLATTAKPADSLVAHRRRQKFGQRMEPFVYLAPTLILLGVFVLYPVLRSLWLSVNEASILGGITGFVGVSNYLDIFTDENFSHYALTSAAWTFGAVGLQLALGMCGALLLNQRIPLRGAVRGLVMIPWATPSVLVA
ncbi:trehalose/maltose transport system permease protein MalF [Arthrobacter sp. Hiyo6]|nr:trehalose/maltose transport system permease protein MalF [Arthrobacter sp. Hiyo6]